MELYIIRHAQSTNNALLDPLQRVCDPPLTELGHCQARTLARHLVEGQDIVDLPAVAPGYGRRQARHEAGYGITRLLCSPMLRALQTAVPVSEALGVAPEVWVGIHEHGGIFLEKAEGIIGYPGQTRAQILADFPRYVLPEQIGEAGWWTGGLEEKDARERRAIAVAVQLHQWARRNERVAIISHGAFIDGLLKVLLNQSRSRMLYYHKSNVSISRLDFRADGLRLDYLNRTDFLPPELMSA